MDLLFKNNKQKNRENYCEEDFVVGSSIVWVGHNANPQYEICSRIRFINIIPFLCSMSIKRLYHDYIGFDQSFLFSSVLSLLCSRVVLYMFFSCKLYRVIFIVKINKRNMQLSWHMQINHIHRWKRRESSEWARKLRGEQRMNRYRNHLIGYMQTVKQKIYSFYSSFFTD